MYTSSTPVYKEPPKALTIEGGDTTYHYLPDFTLLNLEGDTLTKQDMLGKVLIVSFFEVEDDSMDRTTVLHGNLKRIYDNIDWDEKPNLRFLTINTGDPLSAIEAYTAKQEVDPSYWITAYGPGEDIKAFGKAFRLAEFEHWQPGDAPKTIQWIALVDKEGQVRSYYLGTDLAEERRIQEDYIALIRLIYPEDQLK